LNNNKLIIEKLICAFRWSVLPSIMKMHGPKNKKDFIAIIITFYTHSYGLILPKVPFETNYQFSHKTAFRIFIACVDVWNVKSGVSTTTKI